MTPMSKSVKCCFISVFVIIFGIVFALVIYPYLMKILMSAHKILSTDGDSNKKWETTGYPFELNVYVFNYTNAEEVQKGGIPIVEEIGPYYFEVRKAKVDVKYREKDSISFQRTSSFQFNRNLSGPGLTGDETVVLPHPYLMGMVQLVAKSNPSLLHTIDKAMKIFSTDGIFAKVNVMDLLFRSIIINCDQRDLASKEVCAELKNYSGENLAFRGNNKHRYSLFGLRNGTVDQHIITLNRGKTNIMDVGKVLGIDGMERMDKWRGSCNEFQGNEELIFPPFLTEFDKLTIFSTDHCRFFKLNFKDQGRYATVKVNRYNFSIGNLTSDPDLNCFCKAPDTCPASGLMDLSNCVGGSFLLSMPHFYGSDPDLFKYVVGLKPNEKLHNSEMVIEPITGTPLSWKRTFQYNIRLQKIEQIDAMKYLPNTIAPLYWVNESFALNRTFMNFLYYKVFYPIGIGSMLQWFSIIGGVFCCIISAICYFKEDQLLVAFGLKSDGDILVKEVAEEKEDDNFVVEDY